MQQYTLHIQGMSCQGCVASVRNALLRVPGVTEVTVSLPDARAEVQFTAPATTEHLHAAIEDAGYESMRGNA